MVKNISSNINSELDSFDLFVDDIISSDKNLLKGELDILLMQYLFNSLELESLNENNLESTDYMAA
tara:strand:+ start:742 stop:939 length:198 start_codon:yes stop_codon:yes gene_type:complete